MRRRRAQLLVRRRHRPWLTPLLLGSLIALALLVFAAFGNRNGASRSAPEAGPLHIHALGVNPGDGAVFIAAHTGLFRLGEGATKPRRVGDRHQDTMGFTVVGPDRFLGSGHPDLRDNLPPLLGLMESRDSGENWHSISLIGNADFHVLRVRDRRVVGYDSSGGRVMVSRDRGKSWTAHRFAGPLLDLVIGPDRPLLLLGTTQAQLILSRDGGRSWRGISEATGLLAWPQPDRLYLLTSDGGLWRSPDRGLHWKAVGEIGGSPAAFAALSGHRMYAALHDGAIKASNDGGRSWRVLALPPTY